MAAGVLHAGTVPARSCRPPFKAQPKSVTSTLINGTDYLVLLQQLGGTTQWADTVGLSTARASTIKQLRYRPGGGRDPTRLEAARLTAAHLPMTGKTCIDAPPIKGLSCVPARPERALRWIRRRGRGVGRIG